MSHPWSELESYLADENRAGTFPGAAVIAARGEKIVYQHMIGTYCSLTRRDTPLTTSALHPAFSFSKLVTATLLGIAYQDGLLDWSAPVQRYIPEFRGGGKEKITLRHCLTHAAGIPNATLTPVHTGAGWAAFLAQLCALQTEWEPGTKSAYHALTGHFLAAECVRRMTGNKPWAQLCQERLFHPLGATSLTFGLPADSAPVALTPQPKDLPSSLEAHFTFAGHPAGGCLGTIADFLKIVQLHNARGVWRGKRILERGIWQQLHTVQYEREIEQSRRDGKAMVFDPWGLGFLLRGPFPATGSHDWFGFKDQASPTVFGHAGIDTFIGVGDPANGKALIFVTTNSPQPNTKPAPLRNGVTNRVFAALGA